VKLSSRVGLAASACAALVADYPWGDFQGHPHWRNVGWIPFVSSPVTAPDLVQNILLLIPLGFFAAFSVKPRRVIAVTMGLALLVSVLGEWTQLFSHTRFPSATDIVCNVSGAVAAAVMTTRLCARAGTRPSNARSGG
jgi:glycopeptide antibiotics resistance protein